MYKFLIYLGDELILDSQEKYGDEGVYSHDDVAWDLGQEEIFELLNGVSGDDFDPDNMVDIVEDDRYHVEVEEVDE